MENMLLQANEISCRIQQISEKGLSLLLYVTSRDGQKRLDEKYGSLGMMLVLRQTVTVKPRHGKNLVSIQSHILRMERLMNLKSLIRI